MSLFDRADTLLREALHVSAHARPPEGGGGIRAGQGFVATFTVENEGLGERAATHARTVFRDVTLRIEATPYAAPTVDGDPVNDVTLELGELIWGEAASREIPMLATGHLDAADPFARVHVHGHLDLERFFSVGTVHQFTTDVRREVAADAAAERFREGLAAAVLPEGFRLCAWSYDFDDAGAFARVVGDPSRFRTFVRERVVERAEARGLAEAAVVAAADTLEDLYVDAHPSGVTGALALAVWFMGFDLGESFRVEQVLEHTRAYLDGAGSWEQRRALHLFKGFPNDGVLADPVTVPDLPVVVDHGSRTITLWAGSLRG